MQDFAEIADNPEWLLHRYDARAHRFLFIHVPVARMRSEAFLADIEPMSDGSSLWVEASELAHGSYQTVPLHFVFHTAFCRSTLLVKALDIPEVSFGLSEPAVLNDLAMAGARGVDLLRPVLSLLARPVANAKQIVVKPSNVANNLTGEILEASPKSKALLLSGSLSDFLYSVHKKGLMGRTWTRRLYRHVARYAPLDLGWRGDAEFELTDLQVAALAWLLQHRHFAIMLESPLRPRLATLMSSELVEAREQALNAIFDHFDLAADGASAVAVASAPIFSRHAKLGGNYSDIVSAQHEASHSAIVDEEVRMIEQWASRIISQTGLSLPAEKPVCAT